MDKKSTNKLVVCTLIRLVILPKFKSATNFPVPNCDACRLACAMNRNPGYIKHDGIPSKETTISWDKYEF